MLSRIAHIGRTILGRALAPPRRMLTQGATIVSSGGTVAATLARSAVQLPRNLSRSRDRKLRVGIDIRPFYEPLTGVGWYLYYLLEQFALRDDIELLLYGEPLRTDDGPALHVQLPGQLEPRLFDLSGRRLSRFTRPIAAAAFPALIRTDAPDVVFGANYFLPRALSAVATRRVVTVHDLTYRRFPELLQKETLENLEREMSRELFRAEAIICVSESTRRDLLEFYEVDPSRVVTIHSGIAPPVRSDAEIAGLPSSYLLFVSTIEPRKDLATLIRAFELLRDSGRYTGSLVVAGKVGWKSEETVRLMETCRWREAILHLDYVPRVQLTTLYARADAFILPSLYEGFGFPLLEAMSYGTASIAARCSSLPEVGGDAALYFEPGNALELADVIARVASDDALRARLASAGVARAASFRWDRCASETLEVLRSAALR